MRWKRYLPLVLSALLVLSARPLAKRGTDGFTFSSILIPYSFDAKWETVSSPVAQTIFDQKFYYLDKGGQCYAFVSQDNQYIIKFFKQPPFFSSFFIQLCRWPTYLNQLRLKKAALKESRRSKDFTSYLLAFDTLRNETGLIDLHLNRTGKQQLVTLIDKMHIAHEVDIDQMAFAVQKRAELCKPYLERLMKENRESEACLSIRLLMNMIRKRMEKGIVDQDPNFSKNFGFVDGLPQQIDIGRFSTNLLNHSQDDLKILLYKNGEFRSWLANDYPSLLAVYEEELRKYLQ